MAARPRASSSLPAPPSARILEAHGLRWCDLIAGGDTRRQDEPPAADHDVFERLEYWVGGWRGAARDCAQYGRNVLSTWEISFVTSLISFRKISDRQAEILLRLLEKAVAAGAFA